MGIVGPDDRSSSSSFAPFPAPVLRGTYTVKVAKQPKPARKRQHMPQIQRPLPRGCIVHVAALVPPRRSYPSRPLRSEGRNLEFALYPASLCWEAAVWPEAAGEAEPRFQKIFVFDYALAGGPEKMGCRSNKEKKGNLSIRCSLEGLP